MDNTTVGASTWAGVKITTDTNLVTPGIRVTQNGGSTFNMTYSVTRLA
jgi:hypothetical protein